MSWLHVADRKILRAMLSHGGVRVIAVRKVFLDGSSIAQYFAARRRGDFTAEGMGFRRCVTMELANTNPAVVMVYDETNADPIGFYVWKGGGPKILSSRDERMVELADHLAAWFGHGWSETHECG